MGNFNRDRGDRSNDRRGGGSFGGRDNNRSFNRGGNSGRPTMHKAICSECKAECEIPFRPTGDRPIFCSTCFEKQGGSRPNKFGSDRNRGPRFDNRGAGQSNEDSKEILKGIKTLNYKLDELIKILAPKSKMVEIEPRIVSKTVKKSKTKVAKKKVAKKKKK